MWHSFWVHPEDTSYQLHCCLFCCSWSTHDRILTPFLKTQFGAPGTMAWRQISVYCVGTATAASRNGSLAANIFLKCPHTPWQNAVFKRTFKSPGRFPVNRTQTLMLTTCGVKGTQNRSLPLIRHFHTSPQRNVPPILWIFIKPLAKVASIITGR